MSWTSWRSSSIAPSSGKLDLFPRRLKPKSLSHVSWILGIFDIFPQISILSSAHIFIFDILLVIFPMSSVADSKMGRDLKHRCRFDYWLFSVYTCYHIPRIFLNYSFQEKAYTVSKYFNYIVSLLSVTVFQSYCEFPLSTIHFSERTSGFT